MSKSQVQVIEKKARMLMGLNHQKTKLRKKVRKQSLTYLYYLIFEDANYHALNRELEEIGAFVGKYGDPQSEDEYKKYREAGGKTWQL